MPGLLNRTVAVILTADSTSLRTQLALAAREVDSFGKVATSSTNAATKGADLLKAGFAAATVAVAAGLGASVKAAADFEQAMLRIQTNAGASAEEVRNMSKAVLELAPSVGVGPQKLADALLLVEGAGFRGAAAMDLLTTAAKGARISGADLDTVVNALTATLVSGIGGVKGASEAMGVLNAIVGLGRFTMQEFAASMSSGLLSSAKAFGVSLQSVGAAMVVLNNAGEPAEQAATRLRMSLALLAAPTKQSAQLLTDLGLSEDEARIAANNTTAALQEHGITFTKVAEDLKKPNGLYVALQDIKNRLEAAGLSATQQAQVIARAFGGGRSGTAILTLYNDLGQLKTQFDQINSTASTFESAWDKTKATFKQQVAEMVASVQSLAVEMGDRLLPAAKEGLKILRDFAEAAGSAITSAIKHLGGFFDDLADSLSNVVRAVGKAIDGLAPLAGVLATIAGTGIVGVLDALGQTFASVTDQLAHHSEVIQALAIAYGVKLAAALAESAVFAAKWVVSFVQLKIAAAGGLEAMAVGAAKAAAPLALLTAGIYLVQKSLADSTERAKEFVAAINKKQDVSTFSGLVAAIHTYGDEIDKLKPKTDRALSFGPWSDAAITALTHYGKGAQEAQKKIDALTAAQDKAGEGVHNYNLNIASLENATNASAAAITKVAGYLGVDLTQALKASGPERQKIIDELVRIGVVAGPMGQDLVAAGKLSKDQLDALAKSAEDASTAVKNAGEAAEKAFLKSFDIIDAYSKTVEDHKKAIDDQAKAEQDLAKETEQAAQRVAAAKQHVEDANQKVLDSEQKLVDAQRQGSEDIAKAEKAITSAAEDAAARVQAAKERQADANQKVIDAERAVVDAVRKAADDVASAKERQANANQKVLDSEQKLVDAEKQSADDIAKAQDNIVSAVQDSADRLDQARQKEADSVKRVRDAERGLADATQAAADKVVTAEGRLSDAHDKERDAQERLSDARRQAAEDLEGLKRSVEGSVLSQERAEIRLADAREKLDQVNADPKATARDRQKATLDVKEAELDYANAIDRSIDLTEEYANAQRDGVEGSKKVVDAVKAVADAQKQAAEATAALTKAQQDGAREVAKAQEDVAKAQRDAADAQRDTLKAQEEGAKRVAAAQADLVKAQEEGAKRVAAAQRDVADAQTAAAKAALETSKAQEEGAQRVADAQRDVARAQQDAAKAAQETAKAQAEGAQRVVDAQAALAQAQEEASRRVASAERDVADARRDAAKAQADLVQAGVDGNNAVAAAAAALTLAIQAVIATDPAGFWARQAAAMTESAALMEEAQRRGLNPALIQELAQTGADKARTILTAILGDYTGNNIAMANDLYAKYTGIGNQVQSFAETLQRSLGTVAQATAANVNLTFDQLDASLHGALNKSEAKMGDWTDTLLSGFQNVRAGAEKTANQADQSLHKDLGRSFDDSANYAYRWKLDTIDSADDVSRDVGSATRTAGQDIASNLRGTFSTQGSGFYGADALADHWKNYLVTVAGNARDDIGRIAGQISDNLIMGTFRGTDHTKVDFWNWSWFIRYRIDDVFRELQAHPYAQGGFLPSEAVFQSPGTLVQWAEPETQGEWFFPENKKQKNVPLAQEMLGGWGYQVVPVESFAYGGDRGIDERGYPRPPSFGQPYAWTWAPSQSAANYTYGAVRRWDAGAVAHTKKAGGGFLAPRRSYAEGGFSPAAAGGTYSLVQAGDATIEALPGEPVEGEWKRYVQGRFDYMTPHPGWVLTKDGKWTLVQTQQSASVLPISSSLPPAPSAATGMTTGTTTSGAATSTTTGSTTPAINPLTHMDPAMVGIQQEGGPIAGFTPGAPLAGGLNTGGFQVGPDGYLVLTEQLKQKLLSTMPGAIWGPGAYSHVIGFSPSGVPVGGWSWGDQSAANAIAMKPPASSPIGFYTPKKGDYIDADGNAWRDGKFLAKAYGVAPHDYAGHAIVRGATVLDQGGWLMPGYTLAYNGTGSPEPVGRRYISGQGGGGTSTVNFTMNFNGPGWGRDVDEITTRVRREFDRYRQVNGKSY
jgi:TP901 family phage tail tape measure protein